MTFAEGTGQDSQPYKYNGKELDRRLGLNMYDYSARYYEPAIGRFTTVDPLAEKYYSISPYVYVGNNPIKRTDPTGMIWDDLKEAQKLKDNINKVQGGISKEVGDNFGKLLRGGLYKKGLEKVARNLQEGMDRYRNLEQAKNDIDLLGNDQNNTYVLSRIDGGEHKVRQSDGKVYIENSSDALSIHEITHVRQSLDAGGLRFSSNGELYNSGKSERRQAFMEVEAYQMQYSYDRSFPGYTGSKGLKGIDIHSVGNIKDDGKLVYPSINNYSNKLNKFIKEQKKRMK